MLVQRLGFAGIFHAVIEMLGGRVCIDYLSVLIDQYLVVLVG